MRLAGPVRAVAEGRRVVNDDGYTVMVTRRGDNSAWREPAADDRPCEYRCTVCGTSGVWGPTWSWFGSYKEADQAPGRLPVFCTDPCRDQWAEDNARFVGQVGAKPPPKGRRKRG